jgi:hypothetical protein
MMQDNRRSRPAKEMLIVLLLVAQCVVAGNRLSLVSGGKNQAMLRLENADPVAGLQFSIIGRGVTLKSFEGTDRTPSSVLGVYQYLKNATTLNVVILAPVRTSLPIGDGAIGRITFEMDSFSSTDTCELFLTGVLICNQDAKALDVTASRLSWQTHELSGNSQAMSSLEQNYPNPFNPSTTIAYRIGRASHVVLSIYDITGRKVETLVDQYQSVGVYQVRWNADGVSGRRLASGMYIARLQVEGRVSARTLAYSK